MRQAQAIMKGIQMLRIRVVTIQMIFMLILGVFLLFTIMFPTNANAGYCKVTGSPICVESGNKDIGGFTVYKDCWKYHSKYECYNDNYTDYCKSISNIPGCKEISNICKEHSPTGECNNSEKVYRCSSKIKDAESTVYLDSSYTIAKDEKDMSECKDNIISRDCELVEEKCIEGKEIRIINDHEVTKDCWKWDRQYACTTGSKVSDCEEYEKKCKLVSTRCLSSDEETEGGSAKGSSNNTISGCQHIEKTYECLEITGKLPERKKCKKIGYCIGGDCEDYSYPENKNMPKAMAYLHLLKQMGDELKKELCDKDNLGECKIFKGEKSGCRKSVIGFKDC
ncbi:MAG: conjugal transfer protein TraN, partial [Proteobacteria bacterium]|nr:conjugal transfer protein TraN [Pseudomonadota bacterium]